MVKADDVDLRLDEENEEAEEIGLTLEDDDDVFKVSVVETLGVVDLIELLEDVLDFDKGDSVNVFRAVDEDDLLDESKDGGGGIGIVQYFRFW